MGTSRKQRVGGAPGREPRGRAGAPRGPAPGALPDGFRLEVATRHAEAGALAPAWRRLWEESADPNVFLQPEWLLSWAALHVRDGRLAVFALHREDALVAVAPFHDAGPRGARMMLPLGCGPGFEVTEIPGIVTRPADRRRVLAVLVGAIAARSADRAWARLTMSPDDGWLPPHWLQGAFAPVAGIHHQTRACVVLDLAPTWEAQRITQKRNLRESLRRSNNRLERLERPWRVRVEGAGPGWEAAVADLLRLHSLRANAKGRVAHIDWSADPDTAALLVRAAPRLPLGALEITFLDIDGVPVAAQASLRGGGTTYLLMSGFHPEWWQLGAVTHLVGVIVRAAIARGDRRLNLSSGPTEAKLRWSERLELHQDFVLVGPGVRARSAYAGYSSLGALRRFRRESRLHRRLGSP